MKKTLIGLLIASCFVVLAGCSDNSNSSASTSNPQPQVEATKTSDNVSKNTEAKEQTNKEDVSKDTNKTSDKSSTESSDTNIKQDNKEDSVKANTTVKKESSESIKKKDVHIKNTEKPMITPSNNLVVEKRVKNNDTSSDSTEISKYYGTWKIAELIGRTPLNTGSTVPLNKTITISKDNYVNNSFGVNIKNPIYNIAKVSESDFCRGFKMESLKGTGLDSGTVTALDVSSPNKNNPQFDEIYLQDGYIVYLEGGMFFKCIKE
ncbi:hypothetical protein [Clostridium baratii]|uniref:hypothetical protein n=1 Tax=Clostridium baratii TaxID=1561 RepID=UPI0005F2F082|nr:hypothetical protein [Clostridium baratii]KJU72530.1 hypothetical protein UC77_03710 [Clostridium baratii]STB71375.1 Uncharacterised protein [Clostridium baratii]